MTEKQEKITEQRAEKTAMERARKHSDKMKEAWARKREQDAGKSDQAKSLFRELDQRAATLWLDGEEKQPSGHAGGEPMRNIDWLKAEQKCLAKHGVIMEIAEHPLRAGKFALVRQNQVVTA